MMRLLLLAGLCLGTAKGADQAQCSINAAQAVDEMLDSAIFIWASVERCGKPGEKLHCAIDASYAIESVNAMVNVIVRAVGDCGGLAANPCGVAAGKLTQASAGLAGATGGILDKCPNDLIKANAPQAMVAGNALVKQPMGKMATCIVNVKDSMRSLLQAIAKMISAEKVCKKDPGQCAAKAISIISSFASMGQYVAGALGHCTTTPLAGVNASDIKCAAQISAVVHHAGAFASAATSMGVQCHETHARLYEQLSDSKLGQEEPSSVNSMTVTLLAFLPISAVLSFVGGNRFAKYREQEFEQLDTEANLDIE